MNVSVGVKTDVGRTRTGNEDSYLVETPLFVVADGMGGHIAGDVASSTAVSAIAENRHSLDAADPQTLAQLVREANAAVWRKAQSDTSLTGMGTTCTVLLIEDRRAHIAHVGDSRAYRLRDGSLEQVTEDHTLVARMVKEGKLRAEEAERHPQRNIITRALGADADVSVDLYALEISGGDRLLLCSDGLSTMLEPDSIEEILLTESDPQRAADVLVDRANEAGGEDNVTVVVVDVVEGGSGGGSAAAGAPPGPPQLRPDEEAPDDYVYVRPRRRWLRLLIPVLVVAALAGGAYFGGSYVLANSWFVGLNDDGLVTIYRGIPEEIVGLQLKEVERVTDIAVADLPAFKRDDVRNEMKFESLQDAEANVGHLERIMRDFQDTRTGDRRESR